MNTRTKEIVWQVAVFLVLSAILLFGLPAEAQETVYPVDVERADDDSASDLLSNVKSSIAGMRTMPLRASYPQIRVLDSDATGMTILISIPNFRVLTDELQGQERASVRVDGFGHTMEPGWPSLPIGYFTVPVPANRTVRVLELVETQMYARSDLRMNLIDSVFDDDAVRELEADGATGVFPGDLVQAEPVNGSDGEALLGLSVYPVQWEKLADNTEEISFYRQIRVRVVFD